MVDAPWRAAIPSISDGAIMCPAGMLNRRVKSRIRNVYAGPNRHAERLDGAIEVLVVQRIFIVPDASTGVSHFKAHKPDAIGSRSRLKLSYCRTGPSSDRRLLSHRGACLSKHKRLVDSGYRVPLIRRVVVHVALAGVSLAPGVFVRDDVFGFSEICRSRV